MAHISYKTINHELPDNVKWLEDRTILLTKAGSHIYGTNTPNSDTDYKGICIPPKEYYLGLKSINEYNKSGGKNFGERNTKEDIDVVICHINKFVLQAMQGVPNNLDILFCRDEDIIHIDEFGKELREFRKEFLSKEIFKKFSGYALAQKHKLDVKKQHGCGRQDLINQYGFDCYVEETKFLTDSGWKCYDEIIEEDKLGTVNPLTKELEYQNYFERVKKPYEGKIYIVENQYSKCKVTPNHRIFSSPIRLRNKLGYKYIEENSNWNFNSLENLLKFGPVEHHILNLVKNNFIDYPIEDEYLEFLGLFISEGSGNLRDKKIKSLKITQTNKGKQEVFDVMRKLMSKYKIKEYVYKNKGMKKNLTESIWSTHDKYLKERILNDVYKGNIKSFKNKSFPKWISKLSQRQAKILLHSLILGDGTYIKMKNGDNTKISNYYSNSLEISEGVQLLCLLAGYNTTTKCFNTYSKLTKKYKDRYYTRIQNINNLPKLIMFRDLGDISNKKKHNNNGIFSKKYKGNIVCFSVPNENLITKIDGKISIQGNTKFAYHAIRLLYSAIEILGTHDYHSYRPEEERKLLLDIRNGKYTFDELSSMFDEIDSKLKDIYEHSTLRSKPDYDKINKWLIDINERALNYKF